MLTGRFFCGYVVLQPFDRCMKTLIDSCTKNNGRRPASRHQNLIRHVGILKIVSDIVVEILERVQMSSTDLRRKMRNVYTVCNKCYTLLERACNGNMLNKNAMR